ncbi:MAG: glycosyltransferase family 39 protein [Chitinophagales bacterium]
MVSIEKLNRVDLGLFFITIVVLFFIYTYPSVLPQHPKAVHQWRQCDGLSITMMYVHNGLNPFQPEVHNRHGEGKTVAEFPIIYYVNAAIITVIGVRHKDTVTRGMNLMILYLGLFFLFRIGLIVFKNRLLALMPVIFLHSCPIVAYYAASSVPDVAALSFVITGIYFLIKYLIERKEKSFWIALFFTALAGMIKSTILIPYLAFSFVLLLAVITQHEKLKVSIC